MNLGFDPKADPVKNDPPYKPVDPSRPIKFKPNPEPEPSYMGWPYYAATDADPA